MFYVNSAVPDQALRSAVPDQAPQNVEPDHGLHCLYRFHFWDASH